MSTITNLSTDYYVQAGNCGGGSPRFQLGVDTNNDGNVDGNIFVYLGDPPSFNCPQSFQRWKSTGNLMTGSGCALRQLAARGRRLRQDGGADARHLRLQAGARVDLVVDGGWAVGGNQDVLVDDAMYNATRSATRSAARQGDGADPPPRVGPALEHGRRDHGQRLLGALVYTQTQRCRSTNLNELSTDYYVQSGDCGGGSPRISIGLDTDGNGVDRRARLRLPRRHAELQLRERVPALAVDGPAARRHDLRFDTSQLAGGTFYDTWAHAKALAGSKAITQVSLVVDAGWAFGGLAGRLGRRLQRQRQRPRLAAGLLRARRPRPAGPIALGQRVARSIVQADVGAGAAVRAVAARPAVQQVDPGPAGPVVGAGPPEELVVAGACRRSCRRRCRPRKISSRRRRSARRRTGCRRPPRTRGRGRCPARARGRSRG